MNYNPRSRVVSQRGFFSSLQLFVMFAATNVLILGLIAIIVSGEVRPFLLVFGPFFAVVGYWICLKAITARYEIDLEGISIKDIWGRQRHRWTQVQEVWVNTTYFGSFNVNLKIESRRRHVMLLTSLTGNRREVVEAIIEAATTSNPSVQLEGWAEDAYGPPPYGIFTDQATEHGS